MIKVGEGGISLYFYTWNESPVVKMHKRISMLPESTHWCVIRFYETSSHVAKWFKYLCDQRFIHSGFWVQGLKLNVYWYDRWHWREMEKWFWLNDFIDRKSCWKTFFRCSVPFDTQTPSSKISVIQIILGSFSAFSLIIVNDTVADNLVLYLRIWWWFLNDKHAVLTRQVAISVKYAIEIEINLMIWVAVHSHQMKGFDFWRWFHAYRGYCAPRKQFDQIFLRSVIIEVGYMKTAISLRPTNANYGAIREMCRVAIVLIDTKLRMFCRCDTSIAIQASWVPSLSRWSTMIWMRSVQTCCGKCHKCITKGTLHTVDDLYLNMAHFKVRK